MTPNSTDPPTMSNTTAATPRRTWWAVAGLLLCLAGPAVYVANITRMDHPLLRSTGLGGYALLIAGTLIGWFAARSDRRRWLKIVAGFNTFLLALFIFGLNWMAALPATANFDTLPSPPDFSLPDPSGHAVKLSEAYASGPVLLVFYRGFW